MVYKLQFSLGDFQKPDTLFRRLIRILTPFSLYFWLAVFMAITIVLIDRYVVSNPLVWGTLTGMAVLVLFF